MALVEAIIEVGGRRKGIKKKKKACTWQGSKRGCQHQLMWGERKMRRRLSCGGNTIELI
jgi:hypothetical protein